MLNQVVLVGRLTRDITVNKSDKGNKVATLSLAIPRSFKNSDGIYDTDFVDCILFDLIAEKFSPDEVERDIAVKSVEAVVEEFRKVGLIAE